MSTTTVKKEKKAPKVKKPRAAGKIKLQKAELYSGEARLGDLSDWPELAAVPTLERAAALDLEKEGPALDWATLTESLVEVGQLETLKVVKNPDGGWWVVDGRSRRGALESLAFGPDYTVRIEEVTAARAECIARDSMKRRMLPRWSLVYMECLSHADELLSRGRGRPRKGDITDDTMTQARLAERCHVQPSIISICISAIRHFRAHPADREKLEPKILSGLMAPDRVLPAVAGAAATKDKSRTPFSWKTASPHLSALTTNFRAWAKWSAGDRDNFRTVLAKEVQAWPAEVVAIITETLTGGNA